LLVIFCNIDKSIGFNRHGNFIDFTNEIVVSFSIISKYLIYLNISNNYKMPNINALYCKTHFLTFLTEEDGHWIPSINTKTNKGFGVYQCDECSKIWSYAKSRSNFTRTCKNKKCNKPNYPVFMWNHFITIAYCNEMCFTFLTEEDGQWIPNINIENTKSFGVYQCECNKIWSSARSWSNFTQECKKCNLGCLPRIIWENNPYKSKTTPRSISTIEHESEYCEYCKKHGKERCKNDRF